MKMKQKKCRGLLLLALGSLMLTGCGEAPYELTKSEQQLIVSYSAHVVSKFNRYQKDGLTHVPKSEEVFDFTEENNSETEIFEENTEILQPDVTENTESVDNSEAEEQVKEATLDVAFADIGLTFTYLGNEVTDSYMEDDTFALNAGHGKKLLVLKMRAENLTDTAVTLDNMGSGDVFSAKFVMDSGKSYHAKSITTLLLSDFTTYAGTIEPQTGKDMVIVFEIPADTVSVDKLSLKIERNSDNFQINL